MASKEMASGEALTVSVEQAGKMLGIGRNQAYEAANRGDLPGVIRIGKRIVVSRAALERMLQIETLRRGRAE